MADEYKTPMMRDSGINIGEIDQNSPSMMGRNRILSNTELVSKKLPFGAATPTEQNSNYGDQESLQSIRISPY